MKQIFKTLFVLWFYCVVWMLLEIILYGQAENRQVDSIMMCFFTPIIYKAMEEKKGDNDGQTENN